VPRAGWVKPQDDQRLSDHVALGVLTRTFPPALVDSVVRETGREQQRSRLLPSRLVVYYVLALALFSQAGYEEVMRSLIEGLAWESGWRQRWNVPTQPAISQARARLGVEPLRELFGRGCVPLATKKTPGAFWRGRRLMSIDGTCLDVADTPGNDAEFGRPGSARGEGVSAFPQLRMVALAECGTHAIVDAAMGPCSSGETTLSRGVLGSLARGMVVLADRNFFSFGLWNEARGSGAELVWRTKSNHSLPVDKPLGDGSFLSHVQANDDRRRLKHPVSVRVVEYRLDDPARPPAEDTTYRLLTTMLDPRRAPASELAALYPQRWEFETTLDELKTHQRGPRVVLRSKTPEGVRQEAYGYLCAHYAIRALMAQAADDNGVDPDRLSFTRALHAARRSVRAGVGTATHALAASLPFVLAEIAHELLPERRLRGAGRVVKRKMSNYGVKRAEHRCWPQPTRPAADVLRILGPTLAASP
jgi:hypothetical protein